MRKFGNSEFSTTPLISFNLGMKIPVNYRVRDHTGTQNK